MIYFRKSIDNHISLRLCEIIYEVANTPIQVDNGRYAGIDLGIDNFATVVSNTGNAPYIINGKGLKSINQNYNKRKAHLM